MSIGGILRKGTEREGDGDRAGEGRSVADRGGGDQERNDIRKVFTVGDSGFDELSFGFGFLLVFPFSASLGVSRGDSSGGSHSCYSGARC